jgi:glycosyltransferase involved in cell wall biosynthesis
MTADNDIVLCVATEWNSGKGGLSTFNRQLCIILAALGIKVYCYLPDFTAGEYEDARRHGVILIKPKSSPVITSMERLYSLPPLPENARIDTLIGHDWVTGPYTNFLKKHFFPKAKTILFIHTAPGEIGIFKSDKQLPYPAEEKEQLQKELAMDADIVAAVGPHLYFEIDKIISGIKRNPKPIITQFDPGLFEELGKIDFTLSSPSPEVLLLGRIEDYTPKGVDIAIRAMQAVYLNFSKRVNGCELKPKLIIRGASVGTDLQLREKFKELGFSKLQIQIKKYNDDAETISEDIRRASLILMPSRVEGFGLVALEAISNGRPVLVSEASGMAMLLKKIANYDAYHWIISSTGVDNMPDNVKAWSDAIIRILSDERAAASHIKRLVTLYAAEISWERSVRGLLEIKIERAHDDDVNIDEKKIVRDI